MAQRQRDRRRRGLELWCKADACAWWHRGGITHSILPLLPRTTRRRHHIPHPPLLPHNTAASHTASSTAACAASTCPSSSAILHLPIPSTAATPSSAPQPSSSASSSAARKSTGAACELGPLEPLLHTSPSARQSTLPKLASLTLSSLPSSNLTKNRPSSPGSCQAPRIRSQHVTRSRR
jgi:hypothetical protein